MATVSYLAKNEKQPRGGYLNIKDFRVNQFTDGKILDPKGLGL